MKREDVERLTELLAKATPGPWRAEVMEQFYVNSDNGRIANCLFPSYGSDNEEVNANALLIAAAVNALPELLRVYRAWLDAPEASVVSAHMDHIRIDPARGIPLEMVGQTVRLIAEPSGEDANDA